MSSTWPGHSVWSADWTSRFKVYRRAQELFPNDYVTTFNLALSLHKQGDEAAAVDQYQKAITLQPEDASFRKALGISYEKLQKPADAAAAYGEYLRLSPAAPDAEIRTCANRRTDRRSRAVDDAPARIRSIGALLH